MGSGNGYVRFTYARAREEEIREGVRRFAEALTSLKVKVIGKLKWR